MSRCMHDTQSSSHLGVQWATLQSYPFVHAHIDIGGLQNGELAGSVCIHTCTNGQTCVRTQGQHGMSLGEF